MQAFLTPPPGYGCCVSTCAMFLLPLPPRWDGHYHESPAEVEPSTLAHGVGAHEWGGQLKHFCVSQWEELTMEPG